MNKMGKPIIYYGYDNFDITFIFEKYKIIQNGAIIHETKRSVGDISDTTIHLSDVLHYICGYDDNYGIIITKNENLIIIYEVLNMIIYSLTDFLNGNVFTDNEIEQCMEIIENKTKINVDLSYDSNQFKTSIINN